MKPADLNRVRHELDEIHDLRSTMLFDIGPRRWMLALHWNEHAVRRIQSLAERAGFADVIVEPAPIALHRVLGDDRSTVRRDAGATSSWAMIRDRDLPIAASSLPAGRREYPSLALADSAVDVPEDLLERASLVAAVSGAVVAAFDDRTVTSELDLCLRVVHEPYPPFPAHDLRAPQRIAVALGSALGAAGYHGTIRTFDTMVETRPLIDADLRPWTVEAMVAEIEPVMTPPPWWRRLRVRLTSRRSPTSRRVRSSRSDR